MHYKGVDVHMSKSFLDEFDLEVLNKVRNKNGELLKVSDGYSFNVTRNEDQEIVNYFGSSSIRIWYNLETADFPLHWHYAVEIILAIENNYTVRTKTEEYVLDVGDIIIIPAGELHETIAPKDSGARLVMLFDYSSISKLNGFASLNPFLSQIMIIRQDESSAVYNRELSLIKQMARDYADQNSFFELVIYSRLLSFLVTLGRFKLLGNQDMNNMDPDRNKELNKKLSIAFKYIDMHYTEDLSLEDVSSVAGFSKFHFSRLFKQCSGQNFHEYLCYKRIKASELLLMKQELPITDIAFQAGFSSLSTFNRSFKSVNHCSPTEYRALGSKESTLSE